MWYARTPSPCVPPPPIPFAPPPIASIRFPPTFSRPGGTTLTQRNRNPPPPLRLLYGPNGGYELLPKRAKKHSIAAGCGELKATFGPRLGCAAVQQVKQ